jgi:hypothetical protein
VNWDHVGSILSCQGMCVFKYNGEKMLGANAFKALTELHLQYRINVRVITAQFILKD